MGFGFHTELDRRHGMNSVEYKNANDVCTFKCVI